MNDHHGVGLKLAPYMEQQYGPSFEYLRRDQAGARPERRHEPRQARSLEGGAECTCRCTTGCGSSPSTGRASGSPSAATRASRSWASRSSTPTATATRATLEKHGLRCWGAVTLMLDDRDLVHADDTLRAEAVQYIKDCVDLVHDLGGEEITVVPGLVGKTKPTAERRAGVGVGRRRAQGHLRARRAEGRAARAGAAQPLRDVPHQPRRPGDAAGRGRRPRRAASASTRST